MLVGAVLIGIVAVGIAYGSWQWTRGTRALRERLEQAREPIAPARVDRAALDGLPEPVQRFFRTALTDGAPMIASVHVRHRGTFNMGKDTELWKPFVSDQRVIVRRPGFDWDARVAMMPLVPVHVHDAYVAGEGILRAAVYGLLPVMSMPNTRELAQGELMRWLAEAAWYPTALLPGPQVAWQPHDDRSAYATLTDGDLSLRMLFTFGDDGLIASVRSEERGRMVGDRPVPTPWEGRFWDYEERQGMRVPMEGEVAWILPDGPAPYWRGRIERITYQFAE